MKTGEQKLVVDGYHVEFEKRVNELLAKGCELVFVQQHKVNGSDCFLALLRMP